MLGQLRTIGMTKRQIKCMARREGLRYAFAGIPLGLAAGLLIGFAAYPDGFRIKTAAIYTALIAIAGVVMVNIVIYLIFTAYAGAELKKTGILSAIREE